MSVAETFEGKYDTVSHLSAKVLYALASPSTPDNVRVEFTELAQAVETMLKVMAHKGENWSDREIARRCAVSNQFVSNIRPDLSVNDGQIASPRTVLRSGTPYEMNTANIGKRDKAPERVVIDPGPDIDDDAKTSTPSIISGSWHTGSSDLPHVGDTLYVTVR